MYGKNGQRIQQTRVKTFLLEEPYAAQSLLLRHEPVVGAFDAGPSGPGRDAVRATSFETFDLDKEKTPPSWTKRSKFATKVWSCCNISITYANIKRYLRSLRERKLGEDLQLNSNKLRALLRFNADQVYPRKQKIASFAECLLQHYELDFLVKSLKNSCFGQVCFIETKISELWFRWPLSTATEMNWIAALSPKTIQTVAFSHSAQTLNNEISHLVYERGQERCWGAMGRCTSQQMGLHQRWFPSGRPARQGWRAAAAAKYQKVDATNKLRAINRKLANAQSRRCSIALRLGGVKTHAFVHDTLQARVSARTSLNNCVQ